MTLPKGIRYLAGKIRWEAYYKGERIYGTTETVEEAVRARDIAFDKLVAKALKTAPPPEVIAPPPEVKKELETPEQPITHEDCTTLLRMVQFLMHTEWRDAKSMRTVKINAADVLDHFTPNIPLSEITATRIDGYVSKLIMKGNSNSTINRKLSVISKVLKKAAQRGYIDFVPYIQRLPENEGRVRFLTPEEEAQLLGLLKRWGKEREHDAVIVLIDTGMRTGELFKLEIENVDLSKGTNGVVFLHETKNNTSRGVPLTLRAKEALLRLIAVSNDEFVLSKSSEWLRPTWAKAKHVLGFDRDECFVPHVLRHTCCSRLVQKGAPLKKVQAWMGHSSIQTTMRYAHLSPTDLYEMTNLLEEDKKRAG